MFIHSKDVIDPVNSNGEEFETLITNSYVTDLEIYNKNPLTLERLLIILKRIMESAVRN